jgi:DNA-directed RNA polymerase subunit RPC12/RpoP
LRLAASGPAAFQPPADFAPAASSVPGITVYAPRPASTAKVDSPRTYKCPNCGATTSYDVALGGVACEHCGYVAPARSHEVGRRANEFEFTLETLSQAERGWGVARQELHCDNCGADLALTEGALTATCPFCASHKVNLRTADMDHLRPRFLAPFKVLPEGARSAAREWLGRGWFHPDELARAANIDRLAGVYLPFWTFDANINARWRAEVGREKTETYFDAESKSFKTRTVLDWRWESGNAATEIDDLLVAGTSRVSRRILERVGNFDLGALVTYTPDYLAGWQAQAYDVTLPGAWEEAKALMREQAKADCLGRIGSPHVRNFTMTADFADETWRYLLLPVYLAAYRFEDKAFQVMVNGLSGSVAGQKPVAWWKVWLAVGALLAPGLLAGLIGVPLLLLGGAGIVLIGLGAVLLAAGGVLSVLLYRRAVESEAA